MIPVFVELKIYASHDEATGTYIQLIPVHYIFEVHPTTIKKDNKDIPCTWIIMLGEKNYFKAVDTYEDVKEAINNALYNAMNCVSGISELG